jgi:hypothetical protein
MAVMFQVEVFWVVLPFNVVVGYQRFWGPWLPPSETLNGVTTQKTSTWGVFSSAWQLHRYTDPEAHPICHAMGNGLFRWQLSNQSVQVTSNLTELIPYSLTRLHGVGTILPLTLIITNAM